MSNRQATRRRAGGAYRRDEWELLTRLPGRVVVAATSTRPDRRPRAVPGGLAGIDAIAAGRASASRLVRDVVSAIYHESDDGLADPAPGGPVAGLDGLIEDCRAAVRLLAARAGREDADAYRFWLGAIAARACRAARGDGLFDVAGTPAPDAEREFLLRLDTALGRGPR